MYFIGTLIYSTIVYWAFGAIFTVFDLTCWPKALRKYKTQPEMNEPVDKRRLTQVSDFELMVGSFVRNIGQRM